ncbi:hypothetical protein QQY24_31325 [Streptomyces sp. TG1A-8]|uniref:hypothetical protein n=1 Tax=Streptomyces sp. TG1A-8 TaxID=3051385 RepID=UPI00265C51B6|nr:hypothetical protein [Streptomyces sp. TG1A-8]MDO0929636.1 hypothetical protein [Streptomyces sp. TG1A-8]
MTATRGTAPVFFISLRKKRLAAAVSRRLCTRMSSTMPPCVVTLADRPGMILELIVPGRVSLVSSAPPSYKGHRYPVEIISH